MHDPLVQIFTRMSGTVEYTEVSFTGEDAAAVVDLVKAECPSLEGEFVRGTLKGRGASLIVYLNPNDSIVCSIFRPEKPAVKVVQEGPEGVAATVNGNDIPATMVQRALAALPKEQRSVNTALNSVVNDELLRQEAADIVVTDEEVAAARSRIGSSFSQEQLSGLDIDSLAEDRARLTKLLNDRLMVENISVSEESARNYYLQNTNQFIQSEQAVMRHILVGRENQTRDELLSRAQEVAKRIGTTDFCTLVREYSDDKKEGCGTYTIPRGVVDPNLESAAFTTPAGNTTVVETPAGIHFVQTLRVIPAQVVSFSNVSEQLQTTLRNTVAQQRLNLYLQMLRGSADIVVYSPPQE